MTVASTTTYFQYIRNGTTTIWGYPNKVLAATDLVVTDIDKTTTPWTLTPLVLGVDYQALNIDVDTGATISTTVAGVAGHTLDIRTVTDNLQSTSIKNQGSFLPELHEDTFDKLTREIQDLRRRSHYFGIHGQDIETVSWPSLPLPSIRANSQLIFDTNGLPAIGVLPASTFTQTTFNGFLSTAPVGGARTAAEIAAGVTPVNLAYPPYNVLRYGADPAGVTDSTAAFNNCFLAAAATLNGTATASPGSYKITGSLVIDTNKTGFDGGGCCLIATSMTATSLWAPIQSEPDANKRWALNSSHPIRNWWAQGPGQQNANAVGITLNDVTSALTMCGVIFENFGLLDFGVDVALNNGAFGIIIRHFAFGVSSSGSTGPATNYSIIQNPATNGGERNQIVSGTIYNKKYGILQNNSNSDVFVHCVSFDGPSIHLNAQAGTLMASQCHFEASADDNNWFKGSGPNTVMTIRDSEVVIHGSKTAFDLFYCDYSMTAGCMTLDGVLVSGDATMSSHIIGGALNPGTTGQVSGNYRVRNLIVTLASRPPIGYASNLLAYGGFENGNYTAEWALTNAAQSTDIARTGTHSLKLTATTAGSNAFATWQRSASPGDQLVGEFWYQFPTIATGGTLLVTVGFLDKGGNYLMQRVALTTVAVASVWTKVMFSLAQTLSGYLQYVAPPGTTTAQVQFELYNVSSGTAYAYIDDVIINKPD